MSEGKLASYFTEAEDGSFQGPYSNEEIVKQIMTGVLKVEATIYSAEDQRALRAADVIPLLNGPLKIQRHEDTDPNWIPPARPNGISETAPSSTEAVAATNNVSYFALFSERKTKKPSPPQMTQIAAVTKKKKTLSVVPKSGEEKSKLIQVVEKVASKLKSSSTAAPSASFYQNYSRALAATAAVALVFVGTYSLLRSLSNKDKREPASQPGTTQAAAPAKNRIRNRLAPSSPATLSGSTELGSGSNQVLRRSGGVSEQNRALPSEIPPVPVAEPIANLNTPAPEISPTEVRNPAEAVAPALDPQAVPGGQMDPNSDQTQFPGNMGTPPGMDAAPVPEQPPQEQPPLDDVNAGR